MMMEVGEGTGPREVGPKFSLGQVVGTPGALAVLARDEIERALERHQRGDWGNVDEHDRNANERALLTAERLFSSYVARGGQRFWVITEADRSVTTILLPEEY